MNFVDFLNQNQGATNAFLVLALVVATGYYAKKVRDQTNLMLQREIRPMILEEIQYIIVPNIENLKMEIKAARERNFYWHYGGEKGRLDRMFKFFWDSDPKDSLTYRDFFEKYSKLEEKFIAHDLIYDKLNDIYGNIDHEIRTPKLKERLVKLVYAFDNAPQGNFIERPEMFFADPIINGIGEQNMSGFQKDFWYKHKDELLKEFRDTQEVKQLDEEIEIILKELVELNGELVSILRDILHKYRKKFHITEFEIYSHADSFQEIPGL